MRTKADDMKDELAEGLKIAHEVLKIDGIPESLRIRLCRWRDDVEFELNPPQDAA